MRGVLKVRGLEKTKESDVSARISQMDRIEAGINEINSLIPATIRFLFKKRYFLKKNRGNNGE